MSYLTHLKAMLVEAVKATFDDEYPEPDFRNVHCSIEYPVDKMNYPGIWVDYSDVDNLRVAGVDHREYTEANSGGYVGRYTRWRFAGTASFTVTALTSLERDRLYDELVKTLAFGREDPKRRRFRANIESNDFIAANFDFDEIEPQGNIAAPGTPWGTDEIIYERTINMEVIGEFVSDSHTANLVLLSSVIFTETMDTTNTDFTYPQDLDGGITSWH